MSGAGWLLSALAVATAAFIAFAVYKAVISPSCAELGGVSRFSHFQHIYNGKTTQLIPIYRCEVYR